MQPKILRKFGAKVFDLRTERGWTQEDLEELSGLSRNHISYIENGLREACLINIGRLAKAFGISVAELMKDV